MKIYYRTFNKKIQNICTILLSKIYCYKHIITKVFIYYYSRCSINGQYNNRQSPFQSLSFDSNKIDFRYLNSLVSVLENMLKVLSSCHLLMMFEMTDWFYHVERKRYYTTCLRERWNSIPDIQNSIFNTISLKNPYEIPISIHFIVDRLWGRVVTRIIISYIPKIREILS